MAFYSKDLILKIYENKQGMASETQDAENASWDQRIVWHIERQKHRSCRKVSGKLAEEMKKEGSGSDCKWFLLGD